MPYSSDKDVVGALCARQSELVHYSITTESVFVDVVAPYSNVKLR